MPISLSRPIASRLAAVAVLAAGVAAAPAAQTAADFDRPYERLALDQTETRVLVNRRAIFLDPGRHDGSREAEPLLPLQWEILYGQMRTAAEDVRAMPSPKALSDAASTFRERRQLPVAVVWQPFDFIDQQAVDDGRLLVDESGPVPQLYVPDGAQAASPYQQASVFAAAPLYGDDVSSALRGPVAVGGSITLVLPHELFVVPIGHARPSTVVVTAGRQAPMTVALDQPFALSFAYPGAKTIRVEAVVGGARRYTSFELRVREPLPDAPDADAGLVGNSLLDACASRAVAVAWDRVECGVVPRNAYRWRPARRYSTVAEHYYGRQAAAYDYGVKLSPHNPTGRIRRPVIVLSGYDSMEDAGLDDIYAHLVQFDDPETTGPVVGLDQALLEAGYDLVVMDYADSHDFIQRNALAFLDLLEEVRRDVRRAGGSGVPAVIGLSMGGLIARYALTRMEAQGEDHEVGLFVSYDTPHQGALMPVGLEALLADLYGVLDGVLDVSSLYASHGDGPDFVERRLYGPALQQLLTFWAGDDVDASDPAAVRTRIRRDFYDDLLALGDYPDALRRVAISNGNARGRRQVKDPDAGGSHRMQPAEQTLLVEAGLSLLWGAFGTRIELKVQNAPAPGGTAQVYRRRDVTRFLGVPVYSTAAESTLQLPNPYDVVPGSYTETYTVIRKRAGGRDTRESLLGTLAFTWLGAGAYYNVQVDAARHAFVPTASALDWNTKGWTREALVSSTFRRQDLDAGIPRHQAAARTPFDAVLTADDPYYPSGVGLENQPHLFVTEGIEAFILDQLTRSAPDRSAPPLRARVEGPEWSDAGQTHTWEARTRYGAAPYAYQWSWRYVCEPPNEPNDGAAAETCDETLHDGGTGDQMTARLPAYGTVEVALAVEDAAGVLTESFQTVTVEYRRTPPPSEDGFGTSTDGADVPKAFAVGVAPNPARDRALLRVDLPGGADVTAEVFDALGRRVASVSGLYPAGSHAIAVDTGALGRGAYVYRVRAGAEVLSGTFTVVR